MASESNTTRNASTASVLLAVAALLAALGLYMVARFITSTAQATQVVAEAGAVPDDKPNETEGSSVQARSAAAALKERNLFIPPKPKTNPVQGVQGILGDEALINGRWYKVGDKVADAEILSVGITSVKVSWNGQEKEFVPDSSAPSSGPGGPSPDRSRGRPSRPGRPEMVTSGPRPGSPPSGPPREMLVRPEMPANMSPEDMQRFREQMRQQAEARRR